MLAIPTFITFIAKEVVINLIAGGFIRLLRGDTIFFRGWRRRNEVIEPGLLYQRHRKQASEDRFWQAFKSKRDVLLITIKSLHTRNRLKEMIENGEVAVNSLRILTLNPDLPYSIFEALAKHINEPADNCINDCRDAYNVFCELASKYQYIEVRRYDTLPTLQGIIVNGNYAFVELLTYQSNPDERTALMISQADSPNSLRLLTHRFEILWKDSRPQT